MRLITNIDGTTSPRRINLDVSTINTSFNPIELYKEMRALRRLNIPLRSFDVFMAAFGNVPKGGGKFTERYVRLKDCVIVPFDTDHTLTITGTVISDTGVEGVLVFDTSTLTAGTAVNINYVPPQAEVIQISSGSGLSPAQDAKLNSIPSDPWDEVVPSNPTVGSYGERVAKKLLDISKFIGLK